MAQRTTALEETIGVLIVFGFVIGVGGEIGIAIVVFAVIVALPFLMWEWSKPRPLPPKRHPQMSGRIPGRTVKPVSPVNGAPVPIAPTRDQIEVDARRVLDQDIARAATETDELLRDIRVAAAERRYRERVYKLEQE